MFTGIIETCGRVKKTIPGPENLLLILKRPSRWRGLKTGDSVAVNGVCLTLLKSPPTEFRFFCQKETLECSNLGTLQPGQRVNLERAMPANGRFNGHVVQGHVDFQTSVSRVETFEGSWRFWLKKPAGRKDIMHKGCIALDGVSLTLSRVQKTTFAVDIIPHTYQHTRIQEWLPGSRVNVETDVFGKYLIGLLEPLIRDFKKNVRPART